MAIIKFDGEYFSVKDTLECGQVFRYEIDKSGKFIVYSLDKCAFIYNDKKFAYIECEDGDKEYFYNFFDLNRDYADIVNFAKSQGVEILDKAVSLGKGIRILNQDKEEMIFSFIVSQNNNIPRIKSIINKLCVKFGEEKTAFNTKYYAFPTAERLSTASVEELKEVGLGYRADYVKSMAVAISQGLNVNDFTTLPTVKLKEKLTSFYGIGPKVADCISLFGYHRSDSFPVDTWIEKLYYENFSGKEKNRNKITEYFTNRFLDYSGYVQQYLFHYKRNLEK